MSAVKNTLFPKRLGKLIIFEGIDGSGKSTTLERVLAMLDMMAIPHVKLDMIPPGRIRELLLWDNTFTPKQRLLLYKVEGDRARVRVNEALETRQLVFCDRAQFSQLAYQGYGEGLTAEIWTLETLFEPFPVADRIFLFDLPVEVAMERIAANRKAKDHFEEKPLAYHERVRKGYLDQLQGADTARIIDATEPPDRVFDQVLFDILAVWDSTKAPPVIPPAFDSSLQ